MPKFCPNCGMELKFRDAGYCENCERHFCKEHINKFCETCKTPLCNECQTECILCGKNTCKKHTVICESCKNEVCINCVTASRKKLLFKKYTCKNWCRC